MRAFRPALLQRAAAVAIAVVVAGVLPSSMAAPYTEGNRMYNMNNMVGETDPRRYGFSDPGRSYFPSPDDWRRHPVYQVVVDRFNDGDPTNNAQADKLVHDWETNEGPFGGFDIRDLTSRQGGDWRGLAAKLDYIRGMGCRAMWISPVQQNTDNSPMGYLGVDKTLLERRFGKLEDFKFFVDEAHRRGMYVVVDVVNNHLAELLDWVTDGDKDEKMPFRMHQGGALSSPSHPKRGKEPQIRPKAKVREACSRTPGCDPETYQPYVDYPYDNTWSDEGKYQGTTYREAGFAGMPLGIEDENGTGGYWSCNFHHSGEMPESEEGPWNWPLGKLYGTLDDIRTTDDDVVDKLIAASVGIIAALDIDGFRLDTPRECAYSSWTRWRGEVDAAAKRLGKSNFGTWGELWSTPERAATYMGRGKDIPQYFYNGDDAAQKFINPDAPVFDGLINYNYFYWIVTVFRESFVNQTYMAFNILEWESTMGYDIEWPSFPVNGTNKVPRYQMWNFCGSHDQHRFPQFPMGFDRLRLCYAWLYTWPGIPITYQGDEQALVTPGSGLAYWGREMMASSAAWSQIPTVRGEDGVLRNPANGNNFDQGSDYYRFYRRLLNVRDLWWESSFACLGDGANGTGLPQRIECSDADSGEFVDGIFAYRRSCAPGEWGVVMLLNLNNESYDVRCDGLESVSPAGAVRNVLAQRNNRGSSRYSSSFEEESVTDLSRIQLLPFETQALVDEEKAFDLHVDTVSPKHDTAMPLDIWREQRIEIVFTEPVNPESVRVEIAGERISASSWDDGDRRLIIDMSSLADLDGFDALNREGVHYVRVVAARSAEGARDLEFPYAFRVRVGGDDNPITGEALQVNHDIISFDEATGDVYIEHPAIGAEYFRARHAGPSTGGDWDTSNAWRRLDGSRRTKFSGFRRGIPVVVQYYVDGSAAYLVTGCRLSATESCSASYYGQDPETKASMLFRGDLNRWLSSPDWAMSPPGTPGKSGDHNWTIDVFVSNEGSSFLIDLDGDMGHVLGTGNEVANPFFFPFETFCFGSLSTRPRGEPNSGCNKPLLGPLSELDADLCGCDMRIQTLFLGYSGLNHTNTWMLQHFPEDWERPDDQGRPVFHGNTFYIGDASSGLYNLVIPATICPRYTTCRIIFNDLTMTFSIGLSPPGVVGVGEGALEVSAAAAVLFVFAPLIAAVWSLFRRRKYSVVVVTTTESDSRLPVVGSGGEGDAAACETRVPMDAPLPRTVLVASLEHVVAHETGTDKAVTGGLGKVAGLMCDWHPGPLICVHAWHPLNNYEYAAKVEPLHAVVNGKPMVCNVYRYEKPESLRRMVTQEPLNTGEDTERTSMTSIAEVALSPPVTYYIVDHPLFRNRKDIYPVPQTRKSTLQVYSLWSQAVARLIDRLQPDVFHCPDFHGAMAVMYLERPLPIAIMLHNAEYQGAISTQHMGRKEAEWFGDIFDLPAERIQEECFSEGKFSMLKPAINHARAYQEGHGVCAVSRNYALEASQKHAVLWGLPEVRGIENCMPEAERMAPSGAGSAIEFEEKRREAKLFIQKKYGLKQNPDARIFVFVGRWVKQKGVDYIADISEWLLRTYSDAQLIMIGPIGDPYGSYAKEKMESLKKCGVFSESLFVHADFLAVPQELKSACDFCLMPSRDEPFGYVDIEFAWYGASIVGSLRGGLGKLPGFYFEIMNADSSSHMQRQLRKAIKRAMACDSATLNAMSVVARRSCFPVEEWQTELLLLYSTVLRRFDWEAVGRAPPPTIAESLAAVAENEAMEGFGGSHSGEEKHHCGAPDIIPRMALDRHEDRPLSSRFTARSQLHSHRSAMAGGVMLSARSQYLQHSARSNLYTNRSSLYSSRSSCSSSTAVASMLDIELEHRHGLEPFSEEESEFLHQEVTDAEVQAIVEAKFQSAGEQAVPSAGRLLEEVEWQLEISQERSAIARFVGWRVGGAPLIDWVICWCYMTGPIVAAFPVTLFSEESACYFAVDPAVQALALIFWTISARYFSPNRLMAVACLCRLSLLVLPLFKPSPLVAAITVGAVVPSDYLFIFYSFMGSSVGNVAKLAVRTGLIMAVREEWEWVFKGSRVGHDQEALLLSAAALAFSVLPALVLLNAPSIYREFRLPAFDLSWMKNLRFLRLLMIGSALQSLSHVSESALPVLRETAPWTLDGHRHNYFMALGATTLIPIVILALLLRKMPSYAMMVVKGLACFSLPAVLLRCWAQYEVSQSVDLTEGLNFFIFLSVALGALSVYAVAVAILAIVGSRWRFVSYTCTLGVLANIGRVASFGILWLKTGHSNPLEQDYLSQDLAWELFIVALPPCLLGMVFKIAAFFYFDREATGMLRTVRQRRIERFSVSKKSNESLQVLLAQSSMDQPAAEKVAMHTQM